jgi:hypothetical protein
VRDSFLWLALFGGYVVLALIGLIGAVLVWKMWSGTINLARLISEQDGTASMSRFQLLIFTFVIATSLLLLVVGSLGTDKAGFPALDPSILGLLGISGASYVVSKGIQKNFETNTQNPQAPAVPPAAGWPNPQPPARPN